VKRGWNSQKGFIATEKTNVLMTSIYFVLGRSGFVCCSTGLPSKWRKISEETLLSIANLWIKLQGKRKYSVLMLT
jgi:hypothetical protein